MFKTLAPATISADRSATLGLPARWIDTHPIGPERGRRRDRVYVLRGQAGSDRAGQAEQKN